MADQYRKPYIDSAVFIVWIKGEVVDLKNGMGEVVGREDRGRIGEHILSLAEANEFPAYISALTIAEVHKKRHGQTLTGEEDSRILDYFRSEFIKHIDVDRTIGEEANRLCRRFEAERLLPNDAIHLACALRAGCDVLLSWDGPLTSIKHEKIRIEKPRMIGQARLPLVVASGNQDAESRSKAPAPQTPPTSTASQPPAVTAELPIPAPSASADRKSTRLNSSH